MMEWILIALIEAGGYEYDIETSFETVKECNEANEHLIELDGVKIVYSMCNKEN